MNEPLVSVIVPNYNHSAYLMSRIDSILAQDFDNFELILLDDCSTDNSRDILLKYQSDNRVTHIVFNEQNSGTTFKQWDKGLLLARGKYIWIAESDDFAEKNFLTETVTALEGNPDVVLAFTGSQMVDWLFWIEICRQGNVIRINRKLNYFRQHDNKVSPKAEKEGAYFIEGGRILEYMISLLNLSSYQQYVVGGRTLKRLLKDAKTRVGLKQKALNAHPELFRGGVFSIWLYEFDKIFNISTFFIR